MRGLNRAVEKVAADVRVLRQRVGAAHHEQRAVEHVVDVVDERRRRVQDVALEDLDADDEHQSDDQPGRRLSGPGADAIGDVQETLRIHRTVARPIQYPQKTKHHPGRRPGWCSSTAELRQALRRSLLGCEIVIEGHAPAHVVVHVPAHRALGEDLLRLDDLLEDRIVRGLLLRRSGRKGRVAACRTASGVL